MTNNPPDNARKYFYVLAIGTLLNISSYVGILSLQSSMNIQHNLGTTSASLMYITAAFLCIFVTPLLLLRLGPKWSLIIGESGFLIYTVANFHPTFYTLIPGAIIGSLGEALVWSSSPLYLSFLLDEYWPRDCEQENSLERIRHKWFGYFYATIKSCVIWGNLLSYATLYGGLSLEVETSHNASIYYNVSTCGSNFCQNRKTGDLHKYVPASKVSVYVMIALFVAIQLASIVMHTCFLPSIKSRMAEEENIKFVRVIKNTLKSTFFHITSRDQLLLTPIYLYYGYMVGYVFSEFTRAFVSCTIGVQQVGLVMAVYGLFNVLTAVIMGRIAHRYGLIPVFCAGFLYDLLNYSIQLGWMPTFYNRYWVFALGGVLGVSDGVWQFATISTAAVFFDDRREMAYGIISLWAVLGMFSSFLLSGYICVRIHIYSLLALVTLGCIGYAVAETLRGRKASRLSEETDAIIHKEQASGRAEE